MRSAPYMENLVTIYRSLRFAFTSVTSWHLSTSQAPASLALAHIDQLKENPNKEIGDEVRNSAKLCVGKTVVDRCTSLSPFPSYSCKGINRGIGTQGEDMHQGPELPPESSPSSANSKDRNCNGSALGSSGNIEKYKAKMPSEYLLQTTCYAREAKRQKMLVYSSPEAGASNGLTEEKVCYSDNTATSNIILGEPLYAV